MQGFKWKISSGKVCLVMLMFYVGYLHLKIWSLNLLLLDNFAVQTEVHTEMAGMLNADKTQNLKALIESFLISDWNSFQDGSAKSHKGKEVWKYRIAKALHLNSKSENLPVELKEYLVDFEHRQKPASEIEFYQAWNNPLLDWWP